MKNFQSSDEIKDVNEVVYVDLHTEQKLKIYDLFFKMKEEVEYANLPTDAEELVNRLETYFNSIKHLIK